MPLKTNLENSMLLSLAEEIVLEGYPISRGIALGRPFFLNRHDFTIFEKDIPYTKTSREVERYRRALVSCRQEIKRLQKQLEIESVEEGIQILEVQLEMLQDPLLTSEIEEEIHKKGKNAEFVFQQFLIRSQLHFQAMENPFFSERFKDLQDLARRVFCYLNESGHLSLSHVPLNSVVCAPELTASDAAGSHLFCVSAFLTESGGMTSHAAIVAKAKGIPFISNIPLQKIRENGNQLIIVDGRTGKVILNPKEKTLKEYAILRDRLNLHLTSLKEVTKWPAETYDGYAVRLCANVDMTHEIESIHQYGGKGIGLFRSEYLFLPKNEIPSEEEQYQIYAEIIRQMKNLPVVIRTFDLGGDKTPAACTLIKDGNAFVGSRRTRFLLKEKNLFKAQLRSILRASIVGNVSLLLPMIATLSELLEAKKMIQEAREELNLFHPLRLGCMIEVPSAALIIDHIAKECDFFSIGTNDLVQYALAIDRSDQVMSQFHEPNDPSIIRLIKLIIGEANKERVSVSVCGEIASDPRFTALLLGLGVQELSIAPRYLPVIKNAIRRTSIVDAVHLAEKAVAMSTSSEVLQLLVDYYYKSVPEDLFYS